MGKFKVGDIVETKFGIGKVVEIKEYSVLPYLIYHFNWSEGHNNDNPTKYTGNHCLWIEEKNLKPVEMVSNFDINTTEINVSAEYQPTPIKFNIMPDRYVINKGATVLFWGDGTKTIVKKSENDTYDKRLGFLTAYFQKTCGMSKTKANKYLDSLVEQEVKEKKSKLNPKATNEIKEYKKYKVGDNVKVIDTGDLYTGYASWFEENNCKELAKYFDLRQYPDTTKICKIVAIGNHNWHKKQIILAIRPLHNKKIYLIGEEGVEKA